MEPCPACGSDRVAGGEILAGNPGPAFVPDDLRTWAGLREVVAPEFPLGRRVVPGGRPARAVLACTACGLLWTRLDPVRLRAVLREGASAAARERLGLADAPATSDGLPVFPRRA